MLKKDYPLVISPSIMGNALYTPPHLLTEIAQSSSGSLICQLELADVIGKDFGDIPLSKLQSINPAPLLITSARHMTRGAGLGSKIGVEIDAPGGRKTVTPASLAARAAIDRPLAIIALADEVPMTSTAKRVTKSSERTMSMFKALMSTPYITKSKEVSVEGSPVFVFGVAVTGFTAAHLPVMASELIRLGAHGIVIGGANMGESETHLSAVIASTRDAVGPDVPLLCQGCDSMRRLLLALRCGVDLISTNLPGLASALGHALVLPLGSTENASPSSSPDPKKQRTTTAASQPTVTAHGPVLNIWDDAFRADKSPLVDACQCHCCRNHSRAYLHHLLRAKELLAEVLLYQHNSHCIRELFGRVRNASVADRDSVLGGISVVEEEAQGEKR